MDPGAIGDIGLDRAETHTSEMRARTNRLGDMRAIGLEYRDRARTRGGDLTSIDGEGHGRSELGRPERKRRVVPAMSKLGPKASSM